MPKMNAATAKSIAKTEAVNYEEEGGGGGQPLPDDTYICRLMAVETRQPQDQKKKPYWSWKYELVNPLDGYWSNVYVNDFPLSDADYPKAKLKAHLQAHGLTDKEIAAGVDTDDLLGNVVDIVVVQRIIQTGQKQGQTGNEVEAIFAHDGDASKEGDEDF